VHSKTLFRLLAPALALLAFAAIAGPAAASPGAYKVLIVYNSDSAPKQLQQQIAAEPGIATVDLFDTDEGPQDPTAAQLSAYDIVVDTPNSSYADAVAYGNALADYLDGGGVLVQFAYDNWLGIEEPGNGPLGRFNSGGYAPFLFGPNPNDELTLGSFDAASPLMQGVGTLTSGSNTAPGLAPGATLVAKWANDVNAIAYKGGVVSSSAYLGGEEFEGTGNYGRLVVNAVRWLGRQTLSVTNLNPAGGTVTGNGLLCGPTCNAVFNHNAQVSLSAVPNPQFAFAGFGGNCTGTTCNLTMDATKAVSANFYSFGTAKKVKKNKKKGTALLSFGVGGPGKAVLSGKKVKKRSKAAKQAGRIKLPIVAKGKTLKQLETSGKAKVKVQVTFTPTGGSTAVFTKKVTLRLQPSS
jgi:hypothetical protein